jgi:hypothetical protein
MAWPAPYGQWVGVATAIVPVGPALVYAGFKSGGAITVELRPELMPPALDEAKVRHLADLAARLDGANPGQWEDDLTEFNRVAGTSFAIADFQGIYGAEDHEDWVRGVLYRQSLAPRADLSRAEMAEIVSRVRACGRGHDFYLELFLVNCKHLSGSDLLFWPNLVSELPQDREPTAEEIADLAIRGRV